MPKWFADSWGKEWFKVACASGHWLFCAGCWLYLLNMKWLMCGTPFLNTSTSLGCFCPRTIFTKKRIGQVTSDLLYMRFTYYTKDNQQGCSRLSNWFPLRCWGPWMYHLPTVLWSTFWLRFLIVSWFESLICWRGIFLLISCLYSCFMHSLTFAYHLFSQINLLSNSLFIQSTLFWHFP